MAIKKHEEIRLNVKPIFLTLYHEYVFEGPCRFGEGIQLEKEFDLHMAAEKFKGLVCSAPGCYAGERRQPCSSPSKSSATRTSSPKTR